MRRSDTAEVKNCECEQGRRGMESLKFCTLFTAFFSLDFFFPFAVFFLRFFCPSSSGKAEIERDEAVEMAKADKRVIAEELRSILADVETLRREKRELEEEVSPFCFVEISGKNSPTKVFLTATH